MMGAGVAAAAGGIKERGNWKLRALDRYVGIPIVCLLGMARRRNAAPPADPKSFGFLITTAIGDAILNSAAISALRKRFPGARFTAYCSSGNMGIGRMIGGLDEVVHLPVTRPAEVYRLLRSRQPVDVWLDFGPWPRINALYTRFARARYKIGFRSARQYRHYVYDSAVPHDQGLHEVENYLALLRPLGVEGGSLPDIRAGVQPLEGRTAVLHVFPGGSRHYLKSWPKERWIELIGALIGDGYAVYLTGGPADRPKLEALAEESGGGGKVTVVAGTLPLPLTGQLIRSSTVTVSVDTGILHLASALGANLVALHGPTSPARWGALNRNSISLQSGLPCAPCLSIGYEKGCGVNRCMQAISPRKVIESVRRLVDGPREDGERNG